MDFFASKKDITTDLCSGVILAALVEELASENLKINKHPKMRIHCIENVSVCLRFAESKGVKLVNISAEGLQSIIQFSDFMLIKRDRL